MCSVVLISHLTLYRGNDWTMINKIFFYIFFTFIIGRGEASDPWNQKWLEVVNDTIYPFTYTTELGWFIHKVLRCLSYLCWFGQETSQCLSGTSLRRIL